MNEAYERLTNILSELARSSGSYLERDTGFATSQSQAAKLARQKYKANRRRSFPQETLRKPGLMSHTLPPSAPSINETYKRMARLMVKLSEEQANGGTKKRVKAAVLGLAGCVAGSPGCVSVPKQPTAVHRTVSISVRGQKPEPAQPENLAPAEPSQQAQKTLSTHPSLAPEVQKYFDPSNEKGRQTTRDFDLLNRRKPESEFQAAMKKRGYGQGSTSAGKPVHAPKYYPSRPARSKPIKVTTGKRRR